jgi:hypothetical protein
MRIAGLLIAFVVVMVLQMYFLKEAFGASQGGAQIQLAASRPVQLTLIETST